MKHREITLFILNIFIISSGFNSVQAIPITSDLMLAAEVDFDLSTVPLNATQSATIATTSGGLDDIRSVNGTSVSGGITPLTAILSDLNDGISFTGNLSGTADASDIAEAVLFTDLRIEIENSSATMTYQLGFRIDYQLTTDTGGLDAFSVANVNIFDANLLSDFIQDEVVSDTFLSPGQSTTGSVTHFFDITVNPLSLFSLAGTLGINGVAFDIADGFDVSNTLQIILTEVTALPAGIPEPNAPMLLLIGLFSFCYFHIRARRSNAHRIMSTK